MGGEREYGYPRRQSRIVVPGGEPAEGVQIIRFEILDRIDCAACQARAIVLSRPPGVTRVYGEDVYGNVMVFDLCEGWLNESNDDLVGRRGYASLLEWDHEECAIDPGLPIKWEIMSLMRADAGCQE